MLSEQEFIDLVQAHQQRALNPEQSRCVVAAKEVPLLIIAGPGTGKTTVMVLRALRHLLVDRISPEGILITTFTKKAAEEIRTRWLDWGLPLVELAKQHASLQSAEDQLWLRNVDLNHCTTGTLDSICEEVLSDLRPPGTVPPVLIQGVPADQLLMWKALPDYYSGPHRKEIDSYLAKFSFTGESPQNQGEMLNTVRAVVNRFVHDRVDIDAYRRSSTDTVARLEIAAAYEAYAQYLSERSQMDFSLLEQQFLERMRMGMLDETIKTWEAVLVDEYQDTNPLQEQIYFEAVRRSGASLSVVGDDDQSLYRFRGATVELFTNFVPRLKSTIALDAATTYLTRNYRSTPEIIDFFNTFIEIDTKFAQARIQPPKPRIQAHRLPSGLPVMGMFRPDADILASDLAEFLQSIFHGGGVSIPVDGRSIHLAGAADKGDLGDAVMLSFSADELSWSQFKSEPTERLPLKLRRELGLRGLGVFNPRGQALSDQVDVQILLGLVLECLDRSSVAHPNGKIVGQLKLVNTVFNKFAEWRRQAEAFVASNPAPGMLQEFLEAWDTRTPKRGSDWPDEWPLLELCFKLTAWMPKFTSDPEHQVWLEAISRAMVEARLFSAYGGMLQNKDSLALPSRKAAIMDVLRPIAEGLLELEEELITSVPRDRLSIMTIHQAKGLEFPLVIVDVSSRFGSNHPKQAAFRYPKKPSGTSLLEDDLAPFTEVGASRLARTAIDRTFDDLARLYYVAYSRPQTALLLVGLEKSIAAGSTVKSVATGWSRDDTWAWHVAGTKKPTIANNLPLVLI